MIAYHNKHGKDYEPIETLKRKTGFGEGSFQTQLKQYTDTDEPCQKATNVYCLLINPIRTVHNITVSKAALHSPNSAGQKLIPSC
jgi:hypothetical protein